ncbi:MAG TPA: gamma-glutamyl-gamma-aminobutyrate hydrolase family protein [Chitinophagales bacterium]|nr:gamma-glutamyl-gamma-aminobutyrate hydrolase family protein [Chitinophagales bacterium]
MLNPFDNLYSIYYKEKDPFNRFKNTYSLGKVNTIKEHGCIILWGGEDISPSIYNQKPKFTSAPAKPSERDKLEMDYAKFAIENKMPIIGVCRGAQLMCCLSGGSLYQHIQDSSHHHTHTVKTYDDQTLVTSSAHHQALNLKGTKHELLAWDCNGNRNVLTDTNREQITIPEVVYFPETNCLAIQGHPEWMRPTDKFVQWCVKQMEKYFVNLCN